MNDRFPPGAERPRPSAKQVVKIIAGILVLEVGFFLFKQGAAWFVTHTWPLF